MVSCYYKYDSHKRLVPDEKRNASDEFIKIDQDDCFMPDDMNFFNEKDITFLNASAIRMLLMCDNMREPTFYDDVFIKIEYSTLLCRDVILYGRMCCHLSLSYYEYDYYYVIPYDDRIRILTNGKACSSSIEPEMTIHNTIYLDIPLSTGVEELYNITRGKRKDDFRLLPKFMKNTSSYSDIQFEFISE